MWYDEDKEHAKFEASFSSERKDISERDRKLADALRGFGDVKEEKVPDLRGPTSTPRIPTSLPPAGEEIAPPPVQETREPYGNLRVERENLAFIRRAKSKVPILYAIRRIPGMWATADRLERDFDAGRLSIEDLRKVAVTYQEARVQEVRRSHRPVSQPPPRTAERALPQHRMSDTAIARYQARVRGIDEPDNPDYEPSSRTGYAPRAEPWQGAPPGPRRGLGPKAQGDITSQFYRALRDATGGTPALTALGRVQGFGDISAKIQAEMAAGRLTEREMARDARLSEKARMATEETRSSYSHMELYKRELRMWGLDERGVTRAGPLPSLPAGDRAKLDALERKYEALGIRGVRSFLGLWYRAYLAEQPGKVSRGEHTEGRSAGYSGASQTGRETVEESLGTQTIQEGSRGLSLGDELDDLLAWAKAMGLDRETIEIALSEIAAGKKPEKGDLLRHSINSLVRQAMTNKDFLAKYRHETRVPEEREFEHRRLISSKRWMVEPRPDQDVPGIGNRERIGDRDVEGTQSAVGYLMDQLPTDRGSFEGMYDATKMRRGPFYETYGTDNPSPEERQRALQLKGLGRGRRTNLNQGGQSRIVWRAESGELVPFPLEIQRPGSPAGGQPANFFLPAPQSLGGNRGEVLVPPRRRKRVPGGQIDQFSERSLLDRDKAIFSLQESSHGIWMSGERDAETWAGTTERPRSMRFADVLFGTTPSARTFVKRYGTKWNPQELPEDIRSRGGEVYSAFSDEEIAREVIRRWRRYREEQLTNDFEFKKEREFLEELESFQLPLFSPAGEKNIRYIDTNDPDAIIMSGADAIAHGVNLEPVMGAGIAEQLKQLYPGLYESYAKAVKSGQLQSGGMHVFQGKDRSIVNLAFMQHRGRVSAKDTTEMREKYLLESLQRLAQSITSGELKVDKLALPLIGCGFGGLTQKRYREIIEQALGGLNIPVEVYAMRDNFKNYPKGKKYRMPSSPAGGTEVHGINIWSGQRGLGGALTNPTHISKRKGSIKRDYPVEFGGTIYQSAEHAYQERKRRRGDLEMMAHIIRAKFQQYPFLGEALEREGGIPFIETSWHETGARDKWWQGKGRQSPFLRALIAGYRLSKGEIDIADDLIRTDPLYAQGQAASSPAGGRVIIAGSRGITDMAALEEAIAQSGLDIKEVVAGGAKGVDTLARLWAERHGIAYKEFPAQWGTYGKSAGYQRNEEMANYADALIALWDEKSPGTKHMIDIGKGKFGERAKIFGYSGGKIRPLFSPAGESTPTLSGEVVPGTSSSQTANTKSTPALIQALFPESPELWEPLQRVLGGTDIQEEVKRQLNESHQKNVPGEMPFELVRGEHFEGFPGSASSIGGKAVWGRERWRRTMLSQHGVYLDPKTLLPALTEGVVRGPTHIYTTSKKTGVRTPYNVDVTNWGGSIFAPTDEILANYRATKKEDKKKAEWEYTQAYLARLDKILENDPDAFAQLFGREKLVLECYEKAGEFCHRLILARYLNQIGDAYHDYMNQVAELNKRYSQEHKKTMWGINQVLPGFPIEDYYRGAVYGRKRLPEGASSPADILKRYFRGKMTRRDQENLSTAMDNLRALNQAYDERLAEIRKALYERRGGGLQPTKTVLMGELERGQKMQSYVPYYQSEHDLEYRMKNLAPFILGMEGFTSRLGTSGGKALELFGSEEGTSLESISEAYAGRDPRFSPSAIDGTIRRVEELKARHGELQNIIGERARDLEELQTMLVERGVLLARPLEKYLVPGHYRPNELAPEADFMRERMEREGGLPGLDVERMISDFGISVNERGEIRPMDLVSKLYGLATEPLPRAAHTPSVRREINDAILQYLNARWFGLNRWSKYAGIPGAGNIDEDEPTSLMDAMMVLYGGRVGDVEMPPIMERTGMPNLGMDRENVERLLGAPIMRDPEALTRAATAFSYVWQVATGRGAGHSDTSEWGSWYWEDDLEKHRKAMKAKLLEGKLSEVDADARVRERYPDYWVPSNFMGRLTEGKFSPEELMDTMQLLNAAQREMQGGHISLHTAERMLNLLGYSEMVPALRQRARFGITSAGVGPSYLELPEAMGHTTQESLGRMMDVLKAARKSRENIKIARFTPDEEWIPLDRPEMAIRGRAPPRFHSPESREDETARVLRGQSSGFRKTKRGTGKFRSPAGDNTVDLYRGVKRDFLSPESNDIGSWWTQYPEIAMTFAGGLEYGDVFRTKVPTQDAMLHWLLSLSPMEYTYGVASQSTDWAREFYFRHVSGYEKIPWSDLKHLRNAQIANNAYRGSYIENSGFEKEWETLGRFFYDLRSGDLDPYVYNPDTPWAPEEDSSVSVMWRDRNQRRVPIINALSRNLPSWIKSPPQSEDEILSSLPAGDKKLAQELLRIGRSQEVSFHSPAGENFDLESFLKERHNLDPDQIARVSQFYGGGRFGLTTPAAAGKTKTVIAAVDALLKGKHVSPESLLMTGFTVQSAAEQHHRIGRDLGLTHEQAPYAGITFDQLIGKIIRDVPDAKFFQQWYGRPVRPRRPRSFRDLRRVLQYAAAKVGLVSSQSGNLTSSETTRIGQLQTTIEWAKMRGKYPDAFRKQHAEELGPGGPGEGLTMENVARVYEIYQKILWDQAVADYGDFAIMAYTALTKDPKVSRVWRGRFKNVFIDEAQNSNRANAVIASLVTHPEGNLLAVGDPMQNVFDWRASLGMNDEFSEILGLTQMESLSRNYRNPASILDLAGFISGRQERGVVSDPGNVFFGKSQGGLYVPFGTWEEEEQAIGQNVATLFDAGVPASEIAVLGPWGFVPEGVAGWLSQNRPDVPTRLRYSQRSMAEFTDEEAEEYEAMLAALAAQPPGVKDPRVQLRTGFSIGGGEYSHVLLGGMNDFMLSRFKTPRELAQAQRLLYVMATRAKEQLIMSGHRRKGQGSRIQTQEELQRLLARHEQWKRKNVSSEGDAFFSPEFEMDPSSGLLLPKKKWGTDELSALRRAQGQDGYGIDNIPFFAGKSTNPLYVSAVTRTALSRMYDPKRETVGSFRLGADRGRVSLEDYFRRATGKEGTNQVEFVSKWFGEQQALGHTASYHSHRKGQPLEPSIEDVAHWWTILKDNPGTTGHIGVIGGLSEQGEYLDRAFRVFLNQQGGMQWEEMPIEVSRPTARSEATASVAGARRKPWEMTFDEFTKSVAGDNRVTPEQMKGMHESYMRMVSDAIDRGEPVPTHVAKAHATATRTRQLEELFGRSSPAGEETASGIPGNELISIPSEPWRQTREEYVHSRMNVNRGPLASIQRAFFGRRYSDMMKRARMERADVPEGPAFHSPTGDPFGDNLGSDRNKIRHNRMLRDWRQRLERAHSTDTPIRARGHGRLSAIMQYGQELGYSFGKLGTEKGLWTAEVSGMRGTQAPPTFAASSSGPEDIVSSEMVDTLRQAPITARPFMTTLSDEISGWIRTTVRSARSTSSQLSTTLANEATGFVSSMRSGLQAARAQAETFIGGVGGLLGKASGGLYSRSMDAIERVITSPQAVAANQMVVGLSGGLFRGRGRTSPATGDIIGASGTVLDEVEGGFGRSRVPPLSRKEVEEAGGSYIPPAGGGVSRGSGNGFFDKARDIGGQIASVGYELSIAGWLTSSLKEKAWQAATGADQQTAYLLQTLGAPSGWKNRQAVLNQMYESTLDQPGWRGATAEEIGALVDDMTRALGQKYIGQNDRGGVPVQVTNIEDVAQPIYQAAELLNIDQSQVSEAVLANLTQFGKLGQLQSLADTNPAAARSMIDRQAGLLVNYVRGGGNLEMLTNTGRYLGAILPEMGLDESMFAAMLEPLSRGQYTTRSTVQVFRALSSALRTPTPEQAYMLRRATMNRGTSFNVSGFPVPGTYRSTMPGFEELPAELQRGGVAPSLEELNYWSQGQGIEGQKVSLAFARQLVPLQYAQEQLGLRSSGLGLQMQGMSIAFRQATLPLEKEIAHLQVAMSSLSLGQAERRLAYTERTRPLEWQTEDLQWQQQGAQLERSQAALNFQTWLRSMMYGTPNQQAALQVAGLNWSQTNLANARSALTTGLVAPVPLNATGSNYGLAGEQFVAGLEHQRAQMVFGRSRLLTGAAFQENMEFMNKQKRFFERSAQLQEISFAFEQKQAQESLDEQRALRAKVEELRNIERAEEKIRWEEEKQQIALQRQLLEKQATLQEKGFSFEEQMLPLQASQVAIQQAIQEYARQVVEMQKAQQEQELKRQELMLQAQGFAWRNSNPNINQKYVDETGQFSFMRLLQDLTMAFLQTRTNPDRAAGQKQWDQLLASLGLDQEGAGAFRTMLESVIAGLVDGSKSIEAEAERLRKMAEQGVGPDFEDLVTGAYGEALRARTEQEQALLKVGMDLVPQIQLFTDWLEQANEGAIASFSGIIATAMAVSDAMQVTGIAFIGFGGLLRMIGTFGPAVLGLFGGLAGLAGPIAVAGGTGAVLTGLGAVIALLAGAAALGGAYLVTEQVKKDPSNLNPDGTVKGVHPGHDLSFVPRPDWWPEWLPWAGDQASSSGNSGEPMPWMTPPEVAEQADAENAKMLKILSDQAAHNDELASQYDLTNTSSQNALDVGLQYLKDEAARGDAYAQQAISTHDRLMTSVTDLDRAVTDNSLEALEELDRQHKALMEHFAEADRLQMEYWENWHRSVSSSSPAGESSTTGQTAYSSNVGTRGTDDVMDLVWDQGKLSSASGDSSWLVACGIVAAQAQLARAGVNLTPAEVRDVAVSMGLWDPSSGMHGPGSYELLLEAFGANASQDTSPTAAEAIDLVRRYGSVALDTPAHYYMANAYDPERGFHVGASGTVMGGSEWMTYQQMEALGGDIRSLIYIMSVATEQGPYAGLMQQGDFFSPAGEGIASLLTGNLVTAITGAVGSLFGANLPTGDDALTWVPPSIGPSGSEPTDMSQAIADIFVKSLQAVQMPLTKEQSEATLEQQQLVNEQVQADQIKVQSEYDLATQSMVFAAIQDPIIKNEAQFRYDSFTRAMQASAGPITTELARWLAAMWQAAIAGGDVAYDPQKIEVDVPEKPGGSATGAIFTRPTKTTIAEAGVEGVFPLSKLDELLGTKAKPSVNVTVHQYFQGGKITDEDKAEIQVATIKAVEEALEIWDRGSK
jgi:superfamily I DNA/RNA helicase/O-acetyl-ADP-ribose deacetylase (regulator of RNase III)